MAELEIPALPLISELGLDDVIPAVQEGMAGHAQLSTLLALMFSNIKVVDNANGVSFRLPQAGIQLCFHRLQAVYASGAYLRIDDWEYPQAFAEVPEPLLQINNNGSSYTPLPQNLRPPIVWNGESASRMGNARIYADGGGFGSSDVIKVSAVAVGRY